MAISINVATNAQWFETVIDMAGLTAGTDYELVRESAGVTETIAVTTAVADTWIVKDITPPVGQPVTYALRVGGHQVAAAQPVTIAYNPALQTDSPLWDTTSGAWPILRTVTPPALDPLRLPVATYQATYNYRSNVYQVVGSEYPVVASDVATMKQGTLEFLTASNTERHQFINYVRHYRTVHLASPCVDGLQHMFFRVLNVQETVPIVGRPMLRQWSVTYQQVPKPRWYGTDTWDGGRTWHDIAVGAADWATATTTFGATWKDWRGSPTSVGHVKTTGGIEAGSW